MKFLNSLMTLFIGTGYTGNNPKGKEIHVMSQKDRKKWLAALAIVLVLVALCIELCQTGLLERLKNV